MTNRFTVSSHLNPRLLDGRNVIISPTLSPASGPNLHLTAEEAMDLGGELCARARDVFLARKAATDVDARINEAMTQKAQYRFWANYFTGGVLEKSIVDFLEIFNYSLERYTDDKVVIDGQSYPIAYPWKGQFGSAQGISCVGAVHDAALQHTPYLVYRIARLARLRGIENGPSFTRSLWKELEGNVLLGDDWKSHDPSSPRSS